MHRLDADQRELIKMDNYEKLGKDTVRWTDFGGWFALKEEDDKFEDYMDIDAICTDSDSKGIISARFRFVLKGQVDIRRRKRWLVTNKPNPFPSLPKTWDLRQVESPGAKMRYSHS